jgi:hypothetical protein
MRSIKKLSTAITLLALSMAIVVTSVRGDSSTPSTPVNYIGTNISPITTTVSYNYDFLTGTLSPGTATMTFLSIDNVVLSFISDPSPPDPSGSGTFTGTADPFHYNGDEVVYEQSVCTASPNTPANCAATGAATFGGFVTRNMHGDTLDQITNLQSLYNTQSGCDGGGSPRFQIDMSNGNNIFVYFGTYPNFMDCNPLNTWQPSCPTTQCAASSNNMASDSAGLRWDDSQLKPCGTFYQTYTEAVACANSLGLTIVSVSVITDGGWSTLNGGTANGQTFLFKDIQINSITRFP